MQLETLFGIRNNMQAKKQVRTWQAQGLLAAYGVIILVLILLAASNYPVQWRVQVNHERQRYIEVIAQAMQYYVADHSGKLPPLPTSVALIANTDACSAYCPALSKQLSCYNLTKTLVPGYMQQMLQDPLSTSDQQSGFYLDPIGPHILIGACDTYFGQKVEVSVPSTP